MLLALNVNGCVSCEQDVFCRDHVESLRLIVTENGRQRFHDILRVIVEEDDVPRLNI